MIASTLCSTCIVGECISCAAYTHLATDLTYLYYSFHTRTASELAVTAGFSGATITCRLPIRITQYRTQIIWFGEALFPCIIPLPASHDTCLQGLLFWPPTKNAFMMMGRSSSLYMTNSAFKSTTSRHLTTRSR